MRGGPPEPSARERRDGTARAAHCSASRNAGPRFGLAGGPAYPPGVLLPLGTDRVRRRRAVLTAALIVANALVFFYMLALGAGLTPDGWPHAARGNDGLDRILALDAQRRFVEAYGFTPQRPTWYTFVTSAFLHVGWLHILGNMLFLWVFGPNLEDRLGRLGFAALYVAGAVASMAVHGLVERSPAIGASGAIAALTGAYFVLFPRTLVRCVSLFFVYGVLMVPAWWFIGLAVAIDVLVTVLDKTGVGMPSRVATLAHLGGYGLGAAAAALLLATGLLQREDYDLLAAIRHRRRRQQIRGAVLAADRARARSGPMSPGGRRDTGPASGGGGGAETGGGPLSGPRARTAEAVSAGRMDEATEAYAGLIEAARSPLIGAGKGSDGGGEAGGPGVVAGAVLSRRHQLALAAHLMATGRHALAAEAYRGFAGVYRDDAEAPRARLLAALLLGRYVGDRAGARALLAGLRPRLREAELEALADTLERELAGAEPDKR